MLPSPSGGSGGTNASNAGAAGNPTAGGVGNGGNSAGAGSSSMSGSAGQTTTPPKDWNTQGAIFAVTFDDTPLGAYSLSRVAKDFGTEPPFENGLGDGRASIVSGNDAYAGRALRVKYPSGGVGPTAGGVQFIVPIGGNHQELYCAYRIRFDPKFNFVKGGKIPGLSGGNHPTGCSGIPDANDGFTARMMWREGGLAVQYVYYQDQAQSCGDDFPWMVGGTRAFKGGEWYSLEHRLVLNTDGQANGVIQAWFNGQLALDRKDVRLRAADGIRIDSFYFSTFFGGNTSDWAPPSDEYVDFDDIVVSTKPITH
jgi:hypothetical protein